MNQNYRYIKLCFHTFSSSKKNIKGAPVEACDSLLPRHVGTKPIDSSKAPYYLVQSINHYGDDYDHPSKGIKGKLKITY